MVKQAASQFIAGYSREAIDRAGRALRTWVMGGLAEPDDTIIEAVAAMIAFREAFQLPLNKTAMGLRSMAETVCSDLSEPPRPVQRLKRQEQIVRKLHRFPTMKLSTMGDIGGCRIVLDSRQRVDALVTRIQEKWAPKRAPRDMRDQPAESGYRAVHLIVERDRRLIEVQFRTPHEQKWAATVESAGSRLGFALKEGEGPPELLEYLRLASYGLYCESQGLQPEPAFSTAFEAATEEARPHFARESRY